nr:archaeosine biosynthesis radical SAM protein RaSEA [uncultured Blautia sp.]
MKKININNTEAIYEDNIGKEMEKVHSKIPYEMYDYNKPAAIDYRTEWFKGKKENRVVIYLLTNGCEWALSNGHGCTMCGHLAKQGNRRGVVDAVSLKEQFDSVVKSIDFAEYPLVNIYNNGSFLNENEIPIQIQKYILQKLTHISQIKQIVIESRPEYITESSIKSLRECINVEKLEIAIGLECVSDTIRIKSINKGFTLKTFERAVSYLGNIKFRSYVLLKPPFLKEKDAIEEAIRTILYAFEMGAETVSLEACTVQRYTFVEQEYKAGKYSPAWLWSIIEVIKRTHKYGKVIIGLFKFYPSPQRVPFNCSKCSKTVMESIEKYNDTLNFEYLENLDCECKKEWEKIIEL